jgi:hypothetical protein
MQYTVCNQLFSDKYLLDLMLQLLHLAKLFEVLVASKIYPSALYIPCNKV